jgi:hypothetical protein
VRGFGFSIVSEEDGGGAMPDPWFAEVMAGGPWCSVVVVATSTVGVSRIYVCGPCPPLGSFKVSSGVRVLDIDYCLMNSH